MAWVATILALVTKPKTRHGPMGCIEKPVSWVTRRRAIGAPIDRFVTPEEFDNFATLAKAKGFLMVSATPLTRSSHHADEDFEKLKAARAAKQVSA